MRRSTLAIGAISLTSSFGCLFSPCGASECCSGPSAVRVSSAGSLFLPGADTGADTDEIAPPSLRLTMTGGEEDVTELFELVPDGAGGFILPWPDYAQLDSPQRCSFDANMRLELVLPPEGGEPPEPADIPFRAEYRSTEERTIWGGWAVIVESLGWIS